VLRIHGFDLVHTGLGTLWEIKEKALIRYRGLIRDRNQRARKVK